MGEAAAPTKSLMQSQYPWPPSSINLLSGLALPTKSLMQSQYPWATMRAWLSTMALESVKIRRGGGPSAEAAAAMNSKLIPMRQLLIF